MTFVPLFIAFSQKLILILSEYMLIGVISKKTTNISLKIIKTLGKVLTDTGKGVSRQGDGF